MILYDDAHRKICTMSGFKERCITSTLKTGDKELTFSFRKNHRYADQIKEESYIRTKEDEFVIKAIEPVNGWIKCTAQLNVEELEGKQFPNGFTTEENTATYCINAAIKDTGWKLIYCEVTKKRTIAFDESCSAWDIIQSVLTTYRCEVKFDSINKTISIYEKIGKDAGVYLIERLNVKKIQVQSNTYDFATRLIPIGKDGLMINESGKNYIENHQYSKKIKTATWKDDRYPDRKSLTEDAKAKLDELSRPYKSYTVEIKDLAAAQPEKYGKLLAYELGDTVTLISNSEKLKEKNRIVKMYQYPENPDINKVEIANIRLTFEEVQKQEQELKQEMRAMMTQKLAEQEKKNDEKYATKEELKKYATEEELQQYKEDTEKALQECVKMVDGCLKRIEWIVEQTGYIDEYDNEVLKGTFD